MSSADGETPPEPGEGGAAARPDDPAPAPRAGDGGSALDVDAAFAAIVAGWDAAGPSAGGWPAAEDVRDDPRAPAPPPPAAGTARAGGDDPSGAAPAARPPAAPASPVEEEGWEPPELPPLARTSWRTWLPWAGVLGAPLFFLVVVVTGLPLPGLALLGGVLAFVAGFVALVLRLPARRDDDEGDGAVL